MSIVGYCNKCGIEVGTNLSTKFGRPIDYTTSRDFVKFGDGVRCKPCWYSTRLPSDEPYED